MRTSDCVHTVVGTQQKWSSCAVNTTHTAAHIADLTHGYEYHDLSLLPLAISLVLLSIAMNVSLGELTIFPPAKCCIMKWEVSVSIMLKFAGVVSLYATVLRKSLLQ